MTLISIITWGIKHIFEYTITFIFFLSFKDVVNSYDFIDKDSNITPDRLADRYMQFIFYLTIQLKSAFLLTTCKCNALQLNYMFSNNCLYCYSPFQKVKIKRQVFCNNKNQHNGKGKKGVLIWFKAYTDKVLGYIHMSSSVMEQR